mmetsp:Transcript_133518/g.231568  ORF Transcript_133518/g.231568 Transcript_133518/m.231568 type:complete len:211 (+) Transcript_133518:73-705(+)
MKLGCNPNERATLDHVRSPASSNLRAAQAIYTKTRYCILLSVNEDMLPGINDCQLKFDQRCRKAIKHQLDRSLYIGALPYHQEDKFEACRLFDAAIGLHNCIVIAILESPHASQNPLYVVRQFLSIPTFLQRGVHDVHHVLTLLFQHQPKPLLSDGLIGVQRYVLDKTELHWGLRLDVERSVQAVNVSLQAALRCTFAEHDCGLHHVKNL